MKRARSKRTPTPSRKTPAFKLTPAERAIEELRDRRRKLWRELGSYEAVAAMGRKIRQDRLAAKKKRSA